MLFIAALLAASSCTFLLYRDNSNAVALDGREFRRNQAGATEFTAPETGAEGAALIQMGKVLSATMLKDDFWDGAGALAKDDNADLEAAMQEDDAGIDSGKCLNQGSDAQLQKKPQAVPAQTASVVAAQANSFADYFTLFQDVVWFGLAFAAFLLWRCFAEMEKGAEKLAQQTKICKDGGADESVEPVPIRSSAVDIMHTDTLVQAMYSDNKDDLRKLVGDRSVNACEDVCCCTALHIAAHCSSGLAAAEALLARGADANVCDIWDETPLHFAARAGNMDVCAVLLHNGANLNANNANDETPLLVAARAQRTEVCEYLLDKGAHTGGADEDEVPPLLNNLLMSRILRGVIATPNAA